MALLLTVISMNFLTMMPNESMYFVSRQDSLSVILVKTLMLPPTLCPHVSNPSLSLSCFLTYSTLGL